MIEISEIKSFCGQLLDKCAVPPDEAERLVDSLIAAELKGVTSHGLNRLPIYIERIRRGLLKAKADILVEREIGSIAVVDGNFSIAQLVAHQAMEIAIQTAGRSGIAAVLAKNSGHFGMASAYGLQAAKRNMIGIATSNVTPLMPAPGGSVKLIGNNPLAIVAPTRGDPIVADMALSNVAFGKLLAAKNQGKKIPTDWAVDKQGKPTDDPQTGMEGLLLPMAGPKGYSLAVAIEVLTGILGGCFAWQNSSLYDISTKQSISHMMIAINVELFLPFEEYLSRIEEFCRGIKTSEKAEGTKEIFLPGEIEFAREKTALAGGSIELPGPVIAQLNQLAGELGLHPLPDPAR
jgi:LDH2 family malate/lactate/ureidoglycolate dehydrogenase